MRLHEGARAEPVAADLTGTLREWRPLTLLAFLADTAKTGVLTVRGNQHEVRVWVRDGAAVAAEAPAATDLLDGLVEALRTPAGTFEFHLGPVEPPAEVPAEMGTLLQQAAGRLRDWETLSQAVPSLQLVVTLAPVEGEVQLSSDAWAISVAVAAGQHTPAALADHLGWGAFRTCGAVAALVAAGRATLSLPPPRPRFGDQTLEPATSGPAVASGGSEWHASKRPLWPGAT